jgi:hypothetical protein
LQFDRAFGGLDSADELARLRELEAAEAHARNPHERAQIRARRAALVGVPEPKP